MSSGYRPISETISPPPNTGSSVHQSARRPPLGITPRFIHDEDRLNELRQCIYRYIADGYTPILIEWITEYNELVGRINKRKEGTE